MSMSEADFESLSSSESSRDEGRAYDLSLVHTRTETSFLYRLVQFRIMVDQTYQERLVLRWRWDVCMCPPSPWAQVRVSAPWVSRGRKCWKKSGMNIGTRVCCASVVLDGL